MPEGFTSAADLKLIAETNDSEFRAGLTRMREGVREFQESSVANLGIFDRGIKKSGGSTLDFAITSLGALGPYGKTAAGALSLVKDNWELVEDSIRAAGAGAELDELKQDFLALVDTTTATATSLATQYTPATQEAEAGSSALGRGLEFLAEGFRSIRRAIDEWRPAAEQNVDTLQSKLDSLDGAIRTLSADMEAAQKGGAVVAPWVLEQMEALRLEFELTSQILDIKRKDIARASDAATRDALADVTAQIDLLKKQKELLGQPGEFDWYKIEMRAQAELERAGIKDKESIARVLQQMKDDYQGTTDAIAEYNKQKQVEQTVSRTFDAMERETQNLRNRAAALGLAAGEAAKLAAVESGLLSIRQARGSDATADDVRRINELAEARGREAQAAADQKVAYDRGVNFDREVRSIEAATAALSQSTAERTRAAYVERELDRIRQSNREATTAEIEEINRNADAIRALTQAREDDARMLSDIAQSGQIVGRGLNDFFRQWSEGAKITKDSIHDMAVSILADLAQIAFQRSVIDPLIQGIFGGGSSGGGGLLSSIFGGMRAEGGSVEPGKFYLVGEKGPELFVPKGSGDIVSNDRIGGHSVSVTNIIDARGAYPESISDIKRALAEVQGSVPAVALATVREASERGGL